MKKHYTFLILTFGTWSAFAQPVLTQANSTPDIGDSYVYSRINWNGIPPSTGANQTWDYSGIVEIATADMDYVAPGGCPSAASFPNATIACDVQSGTQYEFNQITSTEFLRWGFYAGGITIPYTDAEKIIQFPFTYNDTYVDNLSATFTSGMVFDRAGDVTVTAVGYGTLMLPNSTISDVLLVKVVEDYGDSNMGTEMYHYNIDIYMFYKPGVHIPVFGLTHYVQGSTVVDYGNFMDDPNLGTATHVLDGISVYPVPATDQLSINFNGIQNSVQSVEVYNILGERVYNADKAVGSIDLSTFESGIYFLHVWDGENKTIKKFVKN